MALATGQVVTFDKTRLDGLTDRGSGSAMLDGLF
jgi:hypothetical protein